MSSVKRVAAAYMRKQGQAHDLWENREKSPSGKRYPKSVWDTSRIFGWATPASNGDGTYPEPWRVSDSKMAQNWLKVLTNFQDLYVFGHGQLVRGREALWVGLRDNRDTEGHKSRLVSISEKLKRLGRPHLLGRDGSYVLLLDDLKRNVLR